MIFNVNLDFTVAEHDPDELREIIHASVVSALDANGIESPHVEVTLNLPPRVLVYVDGGMAEVEAVDGVADIAVVDFDSKNGADHDRQEVIIFDRHEGTADELEAAVEDASDRLDIDADAPGI